MDGHITSPKVALACVFVLALSFALAFVATRAESLITVVALLITLPAAAGATAGAARLGKRAAIALTLLVSIAFVLGSYAAGYATGNSDSADGPWLMPAILTVLGLILLAYSMTMYFGVRAWRTAADDIS